MTSSHDSVPASEVLTRLDLDVDEAKLSEPADLPCPAGFDEANGSAVDPDALAGRGRGAS